MLKTLFSCAVAFVAAIFTAGIATQAFAQGQGPPSVEVEGTVDVGTVENPVEVYGTVEVDNAVETFRFYDGDVDMAHGETIACSTLAAIPAGKKMVVEYVSTEHIWPGVVSPPTVYADLRVLVSGVTDGRFDLRMTEIAVISIFGVTRYASSQAVLAYAAEGEEVQVCVIRNDGTDPLTGIVTVTGHYVQTP